MTPSQGFLCLVSSAAAITRGPSVYTKTLKAKQTDQRDNKRGMQQGGLDLFLCDVTVPTHLRSRLSSSARSMLRFSSLSREPGVKTLTFSAQQ